MVFENNWNFEISQRKNRVYAYNLAWIPIYEVDGDQIWVYLDYRVSKYIIKVVKKFLEYGIDFLFISPQFSNPKKRRQLNFHHQNILEYIGNFKISAFYHGFQKINFNLVQNLCKYLIKFQCFSYITSDGETRYIVKEILDEINSEVQDNWTMVGSRIVEWSVPDIEIRERYKNLWREIKLTYLSENF